MTARTGALLFCGVICFRSNSPGQEALRNSVDSDRRAVYRSSRLAGLPYTARVGDLRMIISPGLSLEYNSNVNVSENTPEDDFILRPNLDLNLLHPIGEKNVFSVSATLGYEKYFQNSELDEAFVQPGSVLNFDLFVKDLRINVHDRLDYQLDPAQFGGVGGVGRYGGLNNTAGVLVDWNLGDITVTGGYDFLRFISTATSSDAQSRSTHLFLGRIGAQVHPAVLLGMEGTASPTTYDEAVLNDNTGYSAGIYADWLVTESIRLSPRGGYVIYEFRDSGMGGPVPEYDGFYFGVDLHHTLSEIMTYSLSSYREISPGYTGNLSDKWLVEIQANWSFIRSLPFSTALFYETGKEVQGLFSDNYSRVGATASFSREITKRLSAGLGYTFITQDSNGTGRDYDQHRVTLSVSYRF